MESKSSGDGAQPVTSRPFVPASRPAIVFQPQRGFTTKPGVAGHGAPQVKDRKEPNPNGVPQLQRFVMAAPLTMVRTSERSFRVREPFRLPKHRLRNYCDTGLRKDLPQMAQFQLSMPRNCFCHRNISSVNRTATNSRNVYTVCCRSCRIPIQNWPRSLKATCRGTRESCSSMQ